MNRIASLGSLALASMALWASCSGSSSDNEDGDDDVGGRPPFGGAAGLGGASAGRPNRGGTAGMGASSGTSGASGGEAGVGADGGDGGTSTGGSGGTSGESGGGGTDSGGSGGSGGSSGTGGGGANTGGRSGSGNGGSMGGAGAGAGTGGSGGCVGLECQVVTDACPSGSPTTLTGTVFMPEGTLPLYNARVYVPRTTTLGAIDDQVSCTTCRSPLSTPAVAVALTDTAGRFRLEGVPSGTNVPFVIELGKWRRAVTLATVTKCVENPITNVDLTRLPRTQAEGHIPRIAITTGGSDALECLPRRIGIAASEITNDTGLGRVHLYAGGAGTNSFQTGATMSSVTTLWSNRTKLFGYDAMILSCEGSTSQWSSQKPPASVDNLTAYADAGGRLFFSHLHVYWLQRMAGFSATATYAGVLSPPPSPVTSTVNQAFPKGAALAQWLQSPAVAATTTLGQLPMTGAEHSVTAVTSPTVEWLSLSSNPNNGQHSSQAISLNTPLADPEASQCGRSMFTDGHFKTGTTDGLAGGDDSDVDKPYPTGCSARPMSPQLKALAFLFFDLTGCVQPDRLAPSVP